jgi:hypothetical protein
MVAQLADDLKPTLVQLGKEFEMARQAVETLRTIASGRRS